MSRVSTNLSPSRQKGRWSLALSPCLWKLKNFVFKPCSTELSRILQGGIRRVFSSKNAFLHSHPVTIHTAFAYTFFPFALHCPWHQWAILFHLLTSMDLVTVALQVSHEYRLCWKTAAQRELSYSAQKQTKPFIKGEFPGHLSLLSYLYPFLKRSPVLLFAWDQKAPQ